MTATTAPTSATGPSPSLPRPPSPSDILLVILSAATLLAASFVTGGLMAHPFAP